MITKAVRLWLGSLALICLTLAACGGGASNNVIPTPSPQSGFTIAASPSSLSVAQGGASQSLQVSLNASNGFASSVSATLTSLPSGVTAVPASITLTPGMPATFTFSASTFAQISQRPLIVNAVGGTFTANASFQLNVTGGAVPDSFHKVGGTIVHGFYDESRKLLFATNLALNELEVLSGQDFSIKARVPVPQPVGIDQMADGKTLVVGTAAQEIVTLDEDTLLAIQHPYAAVGNGSLSLFFPNVVAMASGKVLIIGQEQGIDSDNILDAGQFLYEWDATTNNFALMNLPAQGGSFAVDSLARSADHKWAVFSADQFYLYSSDGNNLRTVSLNTVNPPQDEFGVRGYAVNSDGSKIAVASATQVTFLDNSLTAGGSTTLPGAFQTSRTAVQFSPDGTKLFLEYPFPIAIEAIDTNNYTALGYFSALVSPENNNERMLASDSTGRAFVGVADGVRVVDLTKVPVTNPPSGNFSSPDCAIPPSTLPLNTSAQIQLSSPNTTASIYVNGQPAPLLSGGTTITVPASPTPALVDVQCIDSDGNEAVIAGQVSYGVEPLGVSANLLPPTDNPSVSVYGFGFLDSSGNAPSIEVGSRSALRVSAFKVTPGDLQGARVQTPNGTPGESASVTVSSSLGSGALPSAVTYYPSSTVVSGRNLLQLIYDTHRNLLYALTAIEVDVLNPSTLQWQSPFTLPQPSTPVSYNVMALSPDGSRLVISSGDGHVVVLNPDQPAQATLLTAALGLVSPSSTLVITKLDKAIFSGQPLTELDLASLTFKPLNVSTGQLIRSSADGAHLYGADVNSSGGTVYSIDPSTYAVQKESFGFLFWTDLAVSADGSQFAAVDAPPFSDGSNVGFFDSQLRYRNTNVYPDLSPPDDTGVLGIAFSPGGKVLVVPMGDSLELWDTATGSLRARLMTPEELQRLVYPEGAAAPALAIDAAGQTLFALSTSGLTVLTLSQPLDQLPLMQWPQLARASGLSVEAGTITTRMAARHNKSQKKVTQ